ncbi:MAG: aspartate aminotransferase family protein, partial [Dehalococcoidia bacterium]
TNTFTGTRPGGAIASAWAVMNYLGEEGYLRVAREVMQTKQTLVDGINRTEGLQTWGDPELPIFTYGSHSFDIFAVADALSEAGWYVNRIQEPPGIHLMLSLIQVPVVEEYLSDLSYIVEKVRGGKVASRKTEITY